MLRNVAILGLGLGATLLLSGCATIVDGKTQKINLESKKQYDIEINGQTYKSPGVIELKRNDVDAIANVKECDKKIVLKSETNPMFFGNILIGGLLGSTTDASTKSMWKYDKDNIKVDCE